MKASMEKALNIQLALEFESAYAYLGMAAYFESVDYGGFSHWMKAQSQEELNHFHRIFKFIGECGGTIILPDIKKPKTSFNTIIDVFKPSLKQEQKVTRSIHTIYDKALKEKAFASFNFLNWFIEEQVEEEAEVTRLIKELERIESNKSALLLLDRELGKRGSP